jgi:streptomycin 6-kinase
MAMGDAGVAWLAGIDGLVRDLAAEWQLSIGEVLSGGTESLVADATTPEGQHAVLKVAIPGLDPTGSELRTLRAARGRGYAKVFRHDGPRGATLLERLGCPLHEVGLPIGAQLKAICDTLTEAWMPLPAEERFMTGAEKAQSLSVFIATTWRELGEPCSKRAIEIACRFADERRRAFDPATAILAHGDPHAWNTLAVPGAPGRFKLVDPDGLLIERAYDLGILMREWGADLLAGDPLERGRSAAINWRG